MRRARSAALLLTAALACAVPAGAAGPVPIESRLAGADAGAGERVFLQCRACHAAQPGTAAGIGPNLWNIVGRDIALQPGFDYSASLRQVGGRWDYETLDRYLLDPKQVAPAGRMPFAGVQDAVERAQLIAFLRTLSDSPPPLPATHAGAAGAVPADTSRDWDGLPPGPGREEVFYLCRSCHSLMIVKQQGLSRSAWDDTLVWMVAEQGMRPIDAAARERLLDYLSTHFGRD